MLQSTQTSAGIDLGSHIVHLGIVRGGTVVSAAHFGLDKEHTPQQVAETLKTIREYLAMHQVVNIICERPLVFPGGGFPVLQMAELFTLVKLAANDLGCSFTSVTPAQWRKKVLGSGGASKKAAIEFVKGLNFNPDDHNQAEAICIAYYPV